MDTGISAARDTPVSESKEEDYAVEDEEGTDTSPEPEFSARTFQRKPPESISRSPSLLTMELLQSEGKRQEHIMSPSTIRRSMVVEEARQSGKNWKEILQHIIQEGQANTNPFLRRSSRTRKTNLAARPTRYSRT